MLYAYKKFREFKENVAYEQGDKLENITHLPMSTLMCCISSMSV